MNKSTITTLLLVVAVLVLGIAYASLSSQTLTVDGTATVAISNENFDVEFVDSAKLDAYQEAYGTTYTGASVKSQTSEDIGADFALHSDDGDQVENENQMALTITNMTTKGDKVVYNLPIINSTPKDAAVNAVLAVGVNKAPNNQWFKVDAKLDKTTALAPGEVANLEVSVELIKTPITDEEVAAINAEDGDLNKILVTVTGTPQ